MNRSMMNFGVVACVQLLALPGCNDDGKFEAAGTFEATEVTVSSEASGRILWIDMAEGDTVQPHKLVGVIDSVQLYLAKLQAEQALASARSSRPDVEKQIAALKEQIAKQEYERARVEKLVEAQAATTKQLDDVEAQIAVLRSQLTAQESVLYNNVGSADAQIATARIQVEQAADRLSKCKIYSPVAGTILTRYIEAGEYVVQGKPLFKVADLQHVYLRAYVTSVQLADIVLGDTVTVYADFGGDHRREYKGRVAWIASESEFTPKSIPTKDDRANLVYAVKVAVENDGYIKLGMYGEIALDK